MARWGNIVEIIEGMIGPSHDPWPIPEPHTRQTGQNRLGFDTGWVTDNPSSPLFLTIFLAQSWCAWYTCFFLRTSLVSTAGFEVQIARKSQRKRRNPIPPVMRDAPWTLLWPQVVYPKSAGKLVQLIDLPFPKSCFLEATRKLGEMDVLHDYTLYHLVMTKIAMERSTVF